jgi:hypothetical protein
MNDLFGPVPITVWDVARHYLGRGLLTKLLKEHGKQRVKEVTLKALSDEAVEPRPYMLAILQEGGEAPQRAPWQMTTDELMASAKERGISTIGKTTQQLINELR